MSPRITKTITIEVDFWLGREEELEWGQTPSKRLYEFSEFTRAATEAEEELAELLKEEQEEEEADEED